MALERKWERVLPVNLSISGGADGSVVVDDNRGFYVKQKVKIKASTLETVLVQVKKVVSSTIMYVGPLDNNLNTRTDLSTYTVALNATVSAEEQEKVVVPQIDQYKYTYAQEPITARRVIGVDNHGDYYDVDNPLPVQLSDGSIDIGTVQVGDGEDILAINPDGSINAKVTIGSAAIPKVVNISTTAANTENTYTFSVDTKRFRFKVQNEDSKAKISYTLGQSGTNYWTVHRGDEYKEDSVDLSGGVSIYFQLSKANQVVEILYWE